MNLIIELLITPLKISNVDFKLILLLAIEVEVVFGDSVFDWKVVFVFIGVSPNGTWRYIYIVPITKLIRMFHLICSRFQVDSFQNEHKNINFPSVVTRFMISNARNIDIRYIVSVFIFILTFNDRTCNICVRKLYDSCYRCKKTSYSETPSSSSRVLNTWGMLILLRFVNLKELVKSQLQFLKTKLVKIYIKTDEFCKFVSLLSSRLNNYKLLPCNLKLVLPLKLYYFFNNLLPDTYLGQTLYKKKMIEIGWFSKIGSLLPNSFKINFHMVSR
ncbi:hypothetical protein AGLY_001915 [Aphis glycines]|uniref:Uncharacterized protein n=1 Tax=Aphis glycines TaxID=307491 RepID=A0A6G0U4Q2_APHGL|nr:hypothetical protein AGLY_001915 [Aphis glycines]